MQYVIVNYVLPYGSILPYLATRRSVKPVMMRGEMFTLFLMFVSEFIRVFMFSAPENSAAVKDVVRVADYVFPVISFVFFILYKKDEDDKIYIFGRGLTFTVIAVCSVFEMASSSYCYGFHLIVAVSIAARMVYLVLADTQNEQVLRLAGFLIYTVMLLYYIRNAHSLSLPYLMMMVANAWSYNYFKRQGAVTAHGGRSMLDRMHQIRDNNRVSEESYIGIEDDENSIYSIEDKKGGN